VAEPSWKNDRLFTGLASGYPVELFIELIEREAGLLNHSEAKMCNDAWCLISGDETPAGVWKNSMTKKFETMKWDDLKSELTDAFSHKEEYGLDKRLELAQSLVKGESEQFITFLFRVEWVLKTIGNYSGDALLTKLFFLLGIPETDQLFVLEKLSNCIDKSEDIAAIVSLLDDSANLVPQLKQEPIDEYNDFDLGQQSDGYEPQSTNGQTKKRRAKKRALKYESDDSDQETKPLSKVKREKPPRKLKVKKVKKKKLKVGSDVSCNQCGEIFQSEKALTSHVSTNHKVKCMACAESFDWNDMTSWEEHEKTHHTRDTTCRLCPLAVEDFKEMQSHHKSAHTGKQTRCEQCQAPVHYREINHKCKKIPEKMTSIRSMKAAASSRLRTKLRVYHLAKGENPKTVRSMACTLMSYENEVMKWHCGFCYAEFSKETDVKAHHMSFHEGYRFKCDVCLEYKGKSLQETAQHKLKRHGVVTETFHKQVCQVDGCDYQTIKVKGLEYHHKMVHSEEFAHLTTCNICGRRLDSVAALRKHVERVHMNLKSIPCELCSATFSAKYGLAAHMEKEHGAEKQKVCCPLCGSEYRNDQNLQTHIASKHPVEGAQYLPAHKRNQRHECRECNEVFPIKVQLKQHIQQAHSDQSWIDCPQCDKKCRTGQILRGHFLSNHLKVTLKPFDCVTCGSSYVREKDCWIHIAMKHENMSNQWNSTDWKVLCKQKPELIQKRNIREEEAKILKGHIDDKHLPVLPQ